jgi:hypothetical protein
VLVLVAVVQVGIMRMLVHHSPMPVQVAVRFADRIIRRMPMLVVGVVHVPVLMLEWLVEVFVVVRFGKMQIDADPH